MVIMMIMTIMMMIIIKLVVASRMLGSQQDPQEFVSYKAFQASSPPPLS